MTSHLYEPGMKDKKVIKKGGRGRPCLCVWSMKRGGGEEREGGRDYYQSKPKIALLRGTILQFMLQGLLLYNNRLTRNRALCTDYFEAYNSILQVDSVQSNTVTI